MHVSQLVSALREWQHRDIPDVRAQHEHGTGKPTSVHCIDHDQPLRGPGEFLDEVDATDTDVEDPDPARHPLLDQPRSDNHTEAVVPAQGIADSRDQDRHA